MKKVKISEILHAAADCHLRYSLSGYPNYRVASEFSCISISLAVEKMIKCPTEQSTTLARIKSGLMAMGLADVTRRAFIGMGPRLSQSSRYIWLKWAALMAEEQGQ